MDLKVVCINAKNKPVEIPSGCWLEKDEMYSVVRIQKMANQPGTFGVVLEELKLPANCPYDSFAHWRFRPATEDDIEAISAVEKLLEEIGVGEFLELA